MSAPFAPGSVSLRLYPHNDLDAAAIVDELRGAGRARRCEHGFDGVMTSEHHGGFAGYLPNPLQVAGWCLEAMTGGWAAPCPLLLPLRPPALVAEEIAWLAARFPGRVGLGVASGALPADFEIMHAPMDGLAARFTAGFEELAGMLDGRDRGKLADDPAIAACRRAPDARPRARPWASPRCDAPRASARASSSTRSRRPNGAVSSSTRTARPAAPGRA